MRPFRRCRLYVKLSVSTVVNSAVSTAYGSVGNCSKSTVLFVVCLHRMRCGVTSAWPAMLPRLSAAGECWSLGFQPPPRRPRKALWIRISRVDLDFAVVVFLLLLVLLERTESVGQIRRRKAALFDYFDYVRLSASSSQTQYVTLIGDVLSLRDGDVLSL